MMRKFFIAFCLMTGLILTAKAQHPRLIVNQNEVNTIRQVKGQVAAFDKTLAKLISDADNALAMPISVPVPCDGGGGVVHEQHKTNYYAMFHCGLAYQYTGEKKYATYVTDMLMEYARLYPTWGLHPMTLSGLRGRLFWQTLNESVWLMHTSMAYDCIYETLTKKQRDFIEKNLLFNMADFIMNGYGEQRKNHEMFNRMHNHATWATAAVGMTGFTTGNEALVKAALYGSDGTGKTGGFLRQMDELFSPDGYYAEGAYYERYAIWPFVIFAQCIEHNRPDLKIFEYRGRILEKAINALIQLTYEGEFFHFNDALEKGLSSQELTYAVNILYHAFPQQKSLLTVAEKYQSGFLPIIGGYELARDIANGEAQPIDYQSHVFLDGRDGDQGAVGVIRSRDKHLNSALTLKATSHGMEHGHFDKLTMAYYDNGYEILCDYGAARFLNIEAKYSGHYTKENKSFAKQTIAHNTLVVDGKSNYDGKIKVANEHHADIIYNGINRQDMQMLVAADKDAYPGVRMERCLAYITLPFADYPLIVDILRARSEEVHQYDYPMWYNGHMVSTNFPYTKSLSTMETLGKSNGYQHIWVEAFGKNQEKNMSQFTFFKGSRFYTVSTATNADSEMRMLRLGANDPDFNLRPATAYMIRQPQAANHTFATLIETHGQYDVVRETSSNLKSECKSVRIINDDESSTVVEIIYKDKTIIFTLDNKEPAKSKYDIK